MKFSIFIALFFLATLNIFGQTLRSSSSIPEGKIAVLIYANKSDADCQKIQDYLILMDGKEIALIHPGQFFRAAVDPGKHSFQIGKLSAQKVELEIKTKQVYFLRVNEDPGDDKSIGFEIMSADKAWPEIRELKWIDKTNIKDPEIVIYTREG